MSFAFSAQLLTSVIGFSPIIQVLFLQFSCFFSQKWALTILFEKEQETHQENLPEFQGDKPITEVIMKIEFSSLLPLQEIVNEWG